MHRMANRIKAMGWGVAMKLCEPVVDVVVAILVVVILVVVVDGAAVVSPV